MLAETRLQQRIAALDRRADDVLDRQAGGEREPQAARSRAMNGSSLTLMMANSRMAIASPQSISSPGVVVRSQSMAEVIGSLSGRMVRGQFRDCTKDAARAAMSDQLPDATAWGGRRRLPP